MTTTNLQLVKITVRYFARARELAGLKEEQIELEGQVYVQDAVSKIMDTHPKLRELAQDMRFIVNGRLTDDNLALKNGDALVLMPPIAGGAQTWMLMVLSEQGRLHDLVRVTIKFMSIARLHAGKDEVEFSSQKDTLGDVLKEIVGKYNISDLIFAPDGKVRPAARILVNGRSQEFVGGLGGKLSDGDRLAFIYPYADAF